MDRLTPDQRHKNMQAIKCKDSEIELLLRRELWKRGLRYRKNSKSVFGHPDIVFIKKKVAIFCDSEFWHGYDWGKRKDDIKSNKAHPFPVSSQQSSFNTSTVIPGLSPGIMRFTFGS